jgi:uncharacterized iron-regulated protein
MLPEAMLDAMVTVQRARDATLAAALRRALQDSETMSAMLVAGNGHGRTDRGVPADLREASDAKVLSLGLLEVRDGLTTSADYGEAWDSAVPPFDFVAFTPRISDADPCEELRNRFGERARHDATEP